MGEWGIPGRPVYNPLIGRMGKPRPWEGKTPPKDTQQASNRGGWISALLRAPSGLFPAHVIKYGVKVMAGDKEGN